MMDVLSFERIANGLLAICTGLAAILAVRSGRAKAANPEPGRMEIAGALIDSREAAALRASLDANTAALDRNSIAATKSADAIEEVQRDLQDLTRELIRAKR